MPEQLPVRLGRDLMLMMIHHSSNIACHLSSNSQRSAISRVRSTASGIRANLSAIVRSSRPVMSRTTAFICDDMAVAAARGGSWADAAGAADATGC